VRILDTIFIRDDTQPAAAAAAVVVRGICLSWNLKKTIYYNNAVLLITDVPRVYLQLQQHNICIYKAEKKKWDDNIFRITFSILFLLLFTLILNVRNIIVSILHFTVAATIYCYKPTYIVPTYLLTYAAGNNDLKKISSIDSYKKYSIIPYCLFSIYRTFIIEIEKPSSFCGGKLIYSISFSLTSVQNSSFYL